MSTLLAVLLAFPAVVMYHRVDAWSPGDPISQRLTVSPAQFANELNDIRRIGLRTIGIDELAQDAAAQRSPDRAILLTFDDGYSDQFHYAFPILQRFGDRATFFINTATIGTPRHLTWREVQIMSAAGMSIECHGVDHVDLASLSVVHQIDEIDRCERVLQERLGGPPRAFAYPSGDFDSNTVEIERQAGILFGFTTDPRFQWNRQSPYQIVRVRVTSGMSDELFVGRLERTRNYVDFAPSLP